MLPCFVTILSMKMLKSQGDKGQPCFVRGEEGWSHMHVHADREKFCNSKPEADTDAIKEAELHWGKWKCQGECLSSPPPPPEFWGKVYIHNRVVAF